LSQEKKLKKKSSKKVRQNNYPTAPFIPPMLATLTDEVFNSEDWVYEVKWDGYRALAQMNGEDVALWSRNEKSFSDKFYPIARALQEQNLNAVLDGEIAVLNKKGISDFGALQNWHSEAGGQLIFYVFDILWLNGKNLCQLSLTERRVLLKKTFS